MEILKRARVVVTGGAGFIGSHLVDALSERGASVRVVDDLSTGREENLASAHPHVEFVRGSILDERLLREVCAGAEYIFHQAALPSVPRSIEDPRGSHEVNATGTLAVLLAARECGAKRVVYASSSSVYGDSEALPKREDMPSSPLSPYALQKLTAEYYSRMFQNLFGAESVGLRYFNVYGPRQNPNSEYAAVIPKFLRSIDCGVAPTIFGDGETTRDFTFVEDVVLANLLAAVTPGIGGDVFNIANGERVSLNGLVREMHAVTGKSVAPTYGPFREGDIRHSLADVSKAERILGFKSSVALKEGLSRTLEGLRREN